MSDPIPVLSLVTIGVSDLKRSIVFYEALGFARKARASEGVGFFAAGATAFAVFPFSELAKDAGLSNTDVAGFRGVALAWNCRSEAEVDAALARAVAAGATALRPARKAFWGGYLGYFTDPDGHIWEVAHNPGFPLSPDGRLLLPD